MAEVRQKEITHWRRGEGANCSIVQRGEPGRVRTGKTGETGAGSERGPSQPEAHNRTGFWCHQEAHSEQGEYGH